VRHQSLEHVLTLGPEGCKGRPFRLQQINNQNAGHSRESACSTPALCAGAESRLSGKPRATSNFPIESGRPPLLRTRLVAIFREHEIQTREHQQRMRMSVIADAEYSMWKGLRAMARAARSASLWLAVRMLVHK